MVLKEQVENRTVVYQGQIIQVERQQSRLADQTPVVREVVHHQPAVAVLMLTTQAELLLVKQWRAPIDDVTLEIPAGKIEAGETADQAAVRELNEETRLTAAKLTKVTSFYTSPGFTDELMTLYVATGLSPVTIVLPQDTDERIQLVTMTLPAALKAVSAGELPDAKTVMAIWYWQNHPELGGTAHG
ncbi:NUDIX hydrolase [Lactiplantibacillus daowaiensis]|uniref:NUDIX hydrolase n=1 Tax=Lactiplantibacillus daowaiensis TaxID=2559918 RepID=A0ABW1RXA3_9LACO|nr:NUDIX hydrolase [Lactiplantibacillus daowaiensis]